MPTILKSGRPPLSWPRSANEQPNGRAVFIRTKVVKGSTYYQVVRAERDGARVRQVIVAALGRNPTVEAALNATPLAITNPAGVLFVL